jgi:hypothetical protein
MERAQRFDSNRADALARPAREPSVRVVGTEDRTREEVVGDVGGLIPPRVERVEYLASPGRSDG